MFLIIAAMLSAGFEDFHLEPMMWLAILIVECISWAVRDVNKEYRRLKLQLLENDLNIIKRKLQQPKKGPDGPI